MPKIQIKTLQNKIQLKTVKNQITINGRFYPGTGNGSGGGDKNFTKAFPVSTGGIIINHNLGKLPSVTVIDSAKTKTNTNVIYLSATQIELEWQGTFSGTVTLN